jgi:glycosyltransferase involved in cell wall biosynthesis
MGAAARPTVGFILECTLGHATHAANLHELIPRDRRIDARFATVQPAESGPARWLPGWNNWTIQAGRQARRALRAMSRRGVPDALFINTQVPAVLNSQWLRSIPSIVSIDLTPLQFDELGGPYGHRIGTRAVERLKLAANRFCLQGASRVVAWSELARAGLVDAYGVAPDRIAVVSPGVNVDRFACAERSPRRGRLRVLFVGGDFQRKGGFVLLDALHRLRAEGVAVECDIVTRDPVPAAAGTQIHRGIEPNSPALVSLFQEADVFCLPTLADTFGLAFIEASSAGLPVVATDVGPIAELVRDGSTGLLVRPGDSGSLAAALRRLADDRDLVARLGREARRLAVADHDAAKNAVTLVDLLVDVIGSRRRQSGVA